MRINKTVRLIITFLIIASIWLGCMTAKYVPSTIAPEIGIELLK